ncbi:MAG: SpoIID/LytB domain-containing protein [Selenomonadaceae bacterium]|nr:SpoIID/LytB domain-containing protein [Selenomonadaceae bacterium]
MRRHSFFVLVGILCAAFYWTMGNAAAFAADRATVGLPTSTAKTNPARAGQSKTTPADAAKEPAAEKKAAPEKRGRAAKEEPIIRVGLAESQASAVLTCDGAYVFRDAMTGAELGKRAAGAVSTVTVKNRRFAVDGKDVSAKKIRFAIADERSSRFLSVAGEKYRGTVLLLLADDGTITVVNEVKLDDYIGGVISEEMSPDWPTEALKAQAVAARTFAAYSLGKHDDDGYDVCATTCCQVYGGIGSESPEGLRAVSATRGEIMTYQGKPIYAAFYASSGGMTAGSEEMGGTALPYLQAVRDPQDAVAPNRHWQVSMSPRELASKLASAGVSVGTLKAIELTPLELGKSAADRYPSGRVKNIRFIGTTQKVDISGPKLRWIVGLPSTLLDIRYGPENKTAPNTKGKIEISNQNAVIVFDGYGRGHGVGMSQWGAYGMAAKSKYRDILSHYYRNVDVTWLF